MNSNRKFIVTLTVFAVMNGLLCGYTYGVVAGIIPLLQTAKILVTKAEISLFAGAIPLGCIAASVYTGILNDFFGRKKISILTLALYVIGLILFVFADSFKVIYASRAIQGIAFGMAQVVIPMYLSELSPNRSRGSIMTSFQLSLTGGILLSSIVNVVLLPGVNWHFLFYFIGLFPIILIVLNIFLPESPRWFVLKHNYEKAEKIIEEMNRTEDIEEELEKIRNSKLEKEKINIKNIFRRVYIIPILIVTAAVSLNQLFGMPAFIQCSMKILHDSGITSTVIGLLGSTSITGINFIAVILTMLLVDKIGRRRILLIGNTALCTSLVILAVCNFVLPAGLLKGYITLIGIVVIVGFFSFGPGGVIFLIVAELLPNKIRGIGITISFVVGATVGFIFVSLFLPLTDYIGYGGLFLMIAVFMFCYIILVKIIPETKGKSLEEIESLFEKK